MITRQIHGLLFEVRSPSHYVLVGRWYCEGIETEWHISFFSDDKDSAIRNSWDLLGFQGENCPYIEWGKQSKEAAASILAELIEIAKRQEM